MFSLGKGHAEGSAKSPLWAGGRFKAGFPFNCAQPLSSPPMWLSSPTMKGMRVCLPLQTPGRLYTESDIKDFWLILLLLYFGSNSACIFRFTFILNYAMFSGGKLNARILFPLPGSICWRGTAVKENNPWGDQSVWKSHSKGSGVVFASLSPFWLLFYSCRGVIK